MKKKLSIGVSIAALAILLLMSAFIGLGYMLFNAFVSLDYARQQQQLDQGRQQLLQSMLLQTGGRLSQEELTILLEERFSAGHIVKKGDNQISVDDVVLSFRAGALSEVSTRGDEAQ